MSFTHRTKRSTRSERTFEPHPYQVRGIKNVIANATHGLFLDPGMGKTAIILAAFKLLKGKGLVDQMLVIAPLRPASEVWSRESPDSEVNKWTDFHDLRVRFLHGRKKDEALAKEADVYVINPDGLRWLFVNLYRRRPRWVAKRTMLVVDESTDFKHTNTQRFKLMRANLKHFGRRYIMTGTPSPNGLMDLFGQIYLLDQGEALGRYVTHFKNRFFMPTDYNQWSWQPLPGAEEEIQDLIGPMVTRLDEKDHLKLPPLITNDVWVELPPKARRAYAELERTLMLQVEDGLVNASNMGVLTSKLRQLVSGAVYMTEGAKEWSGIHDAKVEAVGELVEELSGQPTLVGYEFHHELERLKKVLGKDTPHLGGGVSIKRQRDIVKAWNAGQLPVLLGQPSSVSRGLNLQKKGRAVIWATLTWNLEHYDQFIRRVWRQGVQERVVMHRVLARGTVDEAVLEAIGAKHQTQAGLLKALKRYADLL